MTLLSAFDYLATTFIVVLFTHRNHQHNGCLHHSAMQALSHWKLTSFNLTQPGFSCQQYNDTNIPTSYIANFNTKYHNKTNAKRRFHINHPASFFISNYNKNNKNTWIWILCSDFCSSRNDASKFQETSCDILLLKVQAFQIKLTWNLMSFSFKFTYGFGLFSPTDFLRHAETLSWGSQY